jgi:hypothetical protein
MTSSNRLEAPVLFTKFTKDKRGRYDVIIAVHGVGNSRPGDLLPPIAAAVDTGDRAIYERRDFVIDGVTYPRVAAPDSKLPDLIEVNWSDLQRAKSSLWGLFAHIAKIVLAASRVAIQWGRANKREERSFSPLLLLPFLLEAAIPWSTALAIYVMFLVTGDDGARWARTVAVTIVGVALALWAGITSSRWSKPLSWGGWVALILFPILSLALTVSPGSKDWYVSAVDRMYAYVQVGSGWYLFIVFLYLIWDGVRLKNTPSQILARFALCWTGVVVLSLGTRVLWAICTTAVAIPSHFSFGSRAWEHWEQEYIRNTMILGRPMATIEFSMYGAMFLIGCLILFGAAMYAMMRWPFRSNSSGGAVQQWLRCVIAAVPVLLFCFGIHDMSNLVITVISLFIPISRETVAGRPESINVAALYMTSMTRILPFLLVVITPAVIMLDVAGDILFYILRDHPLSIRSEVRRRIMDLIVRIETESKSEARIMVIGHSQGSVAAFDALNEMPDTTKSLELITLGSPITSLYSQFLNWPAKKTRKFEWRNCCRPGDYIGGVMNPVLQAEEIPYECANGPGGHINYWNDRAVLDAIFTADGPKPSR